MRQHRLLHAGEIGCEGAIGADPGRRVQLHEAQGVPHAVRQVLLHEPEMLITGGENGDFRLAVIRRERYCDGQRVKDLMEFGIEEYGYAHYSRPVSARPDFFRL